MRRAAPLRRTLVGTLALAGMILAVLTPLAPATAAGLVGTAWHTSTAVMGAEATYSYRFSTTNGATLTRVSATVPPGTTAGAGGLTVRTATAYVTAYDSRSLPSPAATLDTAAPGGPILAVTFANTQYINPGTVISLDIDGIVNTATAGDFGSDVTTFSGPAGAGPYQSVDTGTSPAVTFTAVSLSAAGWSASSTVTGATGVSHTYRFRLPSTMTLAAVTFGVPPGTSAGTLQVGTVTPAAAAGGTVTLAGGRLTYTLAGAGAAIAGTSTITITITGITNTGMTASYAAQITAYSGGTAAATATTAPVSFTPGALTSPSWESTATAAGSSTAYTWNFTSQGMTLSSATFTVPAGTTGTPALGPVTVYEPAVGRDITLAGQSITLAGTTLTFAFTGRYVNAGTTFAITVTGLTTSGTAGTYVSNITTFNGLSPIASASTNTLSLSQTTLGTPIWTAGSTVTGAAHVTYSYSFTISVESPVAAVTLSVPDGTAGAPAVISASPAALNQNGHVQLVAGGTGNTKLVYTFDAAAIPAGTQASLQIGELTNTAVAGTYSAAITVEDAGTAVLASAVTTPISFSPAGLSNASWTPQSQETNAADITYTYTFTTSGAGAGGGVNLSGMTMTVPIGTRMSPGATVTVTDVPPYENSGQPTSFRASVTLVRNTLAVTFRDAAGGAATQWIRGGTAFTVVVTGMTNTPTAGSYSAAIATVLNGSPIDSGTTAARAFAGSTPAAATWSADDAVAGADAGYTFTITTASTAELTAIVITLPAGVGVTWPVAGAVSAAMPAGGTLTASGTTLTYAFPATTVAAGATLRLQATGFTNPAAPGAYRATVATRSGAGTVDQATTPAVAFAARSLTFTNRCQAPAAGCTTEASGPTHITLLAIPGGAAASAAITVTAATNAAHGYSVTAQMSPLSNGAGGMIMTAPTPAADGPDRFWVDAVLTAAPGSGAALCAPYDTGPAGLPGGGPGAGLWRTTAAGGADTLTLHASVRVPAGRPAGEYTATITYGVRPAYTGTAAC